MDTSPATEEWRLIARGSDPLYNIASVPGKRGRWTPEEFYAHGAADWQAFRRHWDHYDPNRGGTCLEIGCGGGRLTAALAPDFDHVVAVDVSADMIERARAVTPENVEFRQTNGAGIPAEDASVDAVFSVHVLQHLEHRGDVVNYIREARRILRPGGSSLIHIMLIGSKPRLRQKVRQELRVRRSRRALQRGDDRDTVMRVRAYWLEDVERMFTSAGFEDVEVRMVRTADYGHMCWFAKAPASSRAARPA